MQNPANQSIISNFPLFTIEEVSNGELKGSLNTASYKTEKWVADNFLGDLMGDGIWLYGRWHLKGNQWIFSIKDSFGDSTTLKEQMKLYALDGYWGERVKMVWDKSIQWNKLIYNKQNEHEHCGICWKTIADDTQYMLGDEVPLCMNCYENYVKTGSLEFITPTKAKPETA